MSDARFDRQVLEQLAQAVADGLEAVLGEPVTPGLHGHFDDHEITSRALPLRALQSSFVTGLADCIVAITNMQEEHSRAAIAAAATRIASELQVEAEIAPPLAYEFAEREEALEQLEALYDEPTVHFATPKGDLLVVFGSGLVHTVMQRNRAAGGGSGSGSGDDAFGAAGGLGPDFPANTPADRGVLEFGDAAHAAPGTAATAFGARGSALGGAETAYENALAADADGRWAGLLSGVEVDLSAELGRTAMSLGEVASLVEESVLTLDQLANDPVTVYVNGALFGTARLVVVDDQYGIEILEVLEPQAL